MEMSIQEVLNQLASGLEDGVRCVLVPGTMLWGALRGPAWAARSPTVSSHDAPALRTIAWTGWQIGGLFAFIIAGLWHPEPWPTDSITHCTWWAVLLGAVLLSVLGPLVWHWQWLNSKCPWLWRTTGGLVAVTTCVSWLSLWYYALIPSFRAWLAPAYIGLILGSMSYRLVKVSRT